MKRNTLRSNPRAGFSLLELLLSIAIIAILIALLSSAVMKVRMAALHLESKHKLGQLALAYHHNEEQHRVRKAADYSDGGGLVFESLLPYLELADSSGNMLKMFRLYRNRNLTQAVEMTTLP
jgi:prepilin-type N-terminal cleavage/methylation domain-containing protein